MNLFFPEKVDCFVLILTTAMKAKHIEMHLLITQYPLPIRHPLNFIYNASNLSQTGAGVIEIIVKRLTQQEISEFLIEK